MQRRANIRSEQGQTMTEFALVLPILLLVVLAITQFGILFNNFVALTDAVRAGARAGAVSRLAADPAGTTISKVKAASSDLDTSKLSISVASDWLHGDDVTVTATYPYSISLLGLVVRAGQLKSTTTERVE